MKNRSVSVTGATGFLGGHVCEAFRDAGWQVRGVVRPGNTKPLPAGIDRIVSPLERDQLVRGFAETDLVVHAAGLTRSASDVALRSVNVTGTQAVVEAVNAVGARLIHVSSLAAVGTGTRARPRQEDDEPKPITPYGRSKLDGEKIVRSAAKVPWTMLRPASIYGPRDRQFLPLFRLASRGLFPLVTNPDAAFTVIHVADVARAIVLTASEAPASRSTFFLGHPEATSADELMKHLADAFGVRYRPVRLPQAVLRSVAWIGDWRWTIGREPMLDSTRLAEFRAEGFVCAVDRAREALGFEAAKPLAEGLKETAHWYRSEGWL
jgi:nucleoside-diphosphate-sugar epimerase